jgi:hypothetical protein
MVRRRRHDWEKTWILIHLRDFRGLAQRTMGGKSLLVAWRRGLGVDHAVVEGRFVRAGTL